MFGLGKLFKKKDDTPMADVSTAMPEASPEMTGNVESEMSATPSATPEEGTAMNTDAEADKVA